MKIAAISDTHHVCHLVSVPDADMLIHAGDMSNMGTFTEICGSICYV